MPFGYCTLRLRNSAAWVRPREAVLPEIVREMGITKPADDEVITPKTRRLLEKMYLSADEDEVLDAGERLDTRMQMKQARRQNAQLLVRNDQLQNTTDQLHGEVRHLHSERQAQQATLVDLSAGINAMQATLEDTPAKVELVKLGDHVARLVQANQRSDGVVRKLEQSVSKLEAEADPGAPSGSGQVQVQLSRAQGRRDATGQQSEIEEMKAHANLMSLAITDLQGRHGDETVKALPAPNDDSKRRQLFGNFLSKAGR
jgi:chromosome segregation ATPase